MIYKDRSKGYAMSEKAGLYYIWKIGSDLARKCGRVVSAWRQRDWHNSVRSVNGHDLKQGYQSPSGQIRGSVTGT